MANTTTRQIGNATLHLADCLDVIPTLDPVDALVTDPPFGIGERTGTISKGRNRNDYASFADTPENIDALVLPRIRLALEKAQRAIITPGMRAAFRYPDPADIGMLYQPAACGMTHWGRITCAPVLFYGKDPRSGKTIQPIHYQLTERAEENGHPCPKPLGLMKWMVHRASLDGETVLDPFMGSGTTGVACVALGRKFVGIEVEERYFDIACARIERAHDQPDLFLHPAA